MKKSDHDQLASLYKRVKGLAMKALGFISLVALPVLIVMLVWASKYDDLLMKIFVTDLVILSMARFALHKTRISNEQKWVTFLCKGLLFMASIVMFPVMFSILIRASLMASGW